MNQLKGTIEQVSRQGSLTLFKLGVGNLSLKAIVIEPDRFFVENATVHILFKETEVLISTSDGSGLSAQNRIPGIISSLEKDDLLSRLVLNTEHGPITSIITTNAVDQLNLQEGTAVTALIKTNEIMLSL